MDFVTIHDSYECILRPYDEPFSKYTDRLEVDIVMERFKDFHWYV